MDVEQYKEDVHAGRITANRQAAKKKIDELERQLG